MVGPGYFSPPGENGPLLRQRTESPEVAKRPRRKPTQTLEQLASPIDGIGTVEKTLRSLKYIPLERIAARDASEIYIKTARRLTPTQLKLFWLGAVLGSRMTRG